ncbi:DUF4258 domain-containing protein [Beggiatoa alba]|nr:DUF4258 domain-containing protein [Beggiatoa alba]
MSESFYSERFKKNVWLTNHAIESMAKRRITLPEVKKLIESGEYRRLKGPRCWIYYDFPERDDNLLYAAIVDEKSINTKTIMVQWKVR